MLELPHRFRVIGPPRATRDNIVQQVQDLIAGGVGVVKMAAVGTDAAREISDEGDLLAELVHPALIRLVTRFTGSPWEGLEVTGLVTEWFDGEPLPDACANLPLGRKLALFCDLLDGVGYVHRRGKLHLDLKPDNILADGSRVRILDLGSARPIDAGPGEAGGTLGYAAPEVLAGQAASTAADVFALGVLLYETLAGRTPWGDWVGEDLYRACVAGDFIPIRAVADVPRPLAEVVASLLEVDPVRRPQTVEEVADALNIAGHSMVLPFDGMPPLLGRHAMLAELEGLLARSRSQPIAIVGPPGSGRRRLARAALYRHPRAVPYLDLTADEGALERALGRMATAGSHHASEKLPPAVLLADLDALPARQRIDVLHLARALASSGVATVVVSERIPEDTIPLLLDGLGPSELGELGLFAGVDTMDATAIAEQVDGLPGRFLEVLAVRRGMPFLTEPLREALEVLRTLPAPIPHALLEQLPDDVAAAVPALEERRVVRVTSAGVTPLVSADATIPEDLRPLLLDWLARHADADATWWSLAAARCEEPALAATRLEEFVARRTPASLEVVRRLAEAGMTRAVTARAWDLLDVEDANGARCLLESHQDSLDSRGLSVLARTLRRTGDLDAARVVAQRAHELEPGNDFARSELADLLAREGRFDEAEAILGPPSRDRPLQISSWVEVQWQRYRHGLETPRLHELFALELDTEKLSDSTLATLARHHIRVGNLALGVRLLEQAVRAADAAGSMRRSAEQRLALGQELVKVGRAREAREHLRTASRLARSLHSSQLSMIAAFILAQLELSLGRLAQAERQVAAFEALAASSRSAEAAIWRRLLPAELEIERGCWSEALALVEDLDVTGTGMEIRCAHALTLGSALLATGHPAEALAALADVDSPDPRDAIRLRTLRGRANLKVARNQFAEAERLLPAEPTPSERLVAGRALLAAAGEELDPSSFAERREKLRRAAILLAGPEASVAATLRDRLLVGAGAELDQIVALIDAVDDPRAFPGALAQLVVKALGANRVLIMVRIPGLGRQRAWRELSGLEAAGIGQEVLDRIRAPNDVWRADNAFADPLLREASATVRTFEIKSLIAVAIPHGEEAIGALYVDDVHRSNRFDDHDVAVLQRLATAVGRIVQLLPARRRRSSPLSVSDVHGVFLTDPEMASGMQATVDLLKGQRNVNILLTGPTGAGKTWFARRLATEVLGARGVEEIVLRPGEVQMLVSQLGGTKKGEFTGATSTLGVIERAIQSNHVLFLDELQNLSEEGQRVLLPLLELPERRFGGLTSAATSLRGSLPILLGTNAPVDDELWKRVFREDLWYRMSQNRIDLPPLSDRGREAIYRYLAEMMGIVLKQRLGISRPPSPEDVLRVDALEHLTNHSWPGNLRELHGLAEKLATVFAKEHRQLTLADLHRVGFQSEITRPGPSPAVDEPKRILEILEQHDFVQSHAAQELGVSKHTLGRMIRKFGLAAVVRARRQELGGGRRGPLPKA